MYSATAARISDGSILVFAIILWISLLLLIMYDNFREKLALYIIRLYICIVFTPEVV